jgi:flagellar hook assembly protein FlgD
MKKLIGILLAVLALTLIIGCQTTKPTPTPTPTPTPVVVPTGTNAVQVQEKGFSPSSGPMELKLMFGNPSAIDSWKVDIAGDNGVVYTFKDTKVVDNVQWGGQNDSGSLVPDGKYSAILSVSYKNVSKPVVAQSSQFVLVSSAPAVSLLASSLLITPNEKGGIDPIKFTIAGMSPFADISSWTLNVFDNASKEVATASATASKPNDVYTWDGKVEFGNSVDPTKPYEVVVSVKDEFGNVGKAMVNLAASTSKKAVMIDLTSDKYTLGGPDMKFNMSFGKLAIEVKSWKIELKKGNDVIRTINSSGLFLSKSASWDGKNDNGSSAPEGQYTAALSVDYGLVFGQAMAISAPFTVVSK